MMTLPVPPKTDLKGEPSAGSEVAIVPGFPTEGPRKFDESSRSRAGSPVLVRRLSLDDKAKLKAFSIENDNAGWLQKKLFKKDVEWPRELYVDVLSCKALLPPAPGNAQQSSASSGMYAETATASVTTEGDGDRNAIEPETPAAGARSVKSVSLAEKVVAGGVTPEGCADVAVGGPETAAEGADGDRVVIDCSAGIEKPCQPDAGEMGSVVGETDEDEALSGSGSGSSGSTSSEGEEEEVVEGVGELEDGIGVDYAREGMECFVRIHNATTGRDLQTQAVKGGADPVFREAFVVPCQGPRDAVVLGVYVGEGDESECIGEAALPLDARVVGVSHPVVLSVKDAQGRNRGFLRVEAFWMDEAKPRKEKGEFYYKVVHPSGVSLRSRPSMTAERGLHVMEFGEVFQACERQWHVGDGECSIFVKVHTSRDRWARTGWCFEMLCDGKGGGEAVLQRTSSPRRETGRFFYRVCNVSGARLHSKADPRSKLRKQVIPEGQVLEASQKWTPAGSPVTFVTIDNDRGYIIQRCGEQVIKNAAGEPTLEQIECPQGVIVSSVGVPVHSTPPLSPPRTSSARDSGGSRSPSTSPTKPRTARAASMISAAEAAAAAAAVRRLYRVKQPEGIIAIRTPDMVAPAVDVLEQGSSFYGKAEVVKRYEGIGEVAFVMRETDGLWVRANRPGLSLMLDCFTNRVEAGAFTYRVCHENGVVVRTAPGLYAPPVKPRRILPVTKLINVCERLHRAEDIMTMSRPPTFLRLAGNDGWVFDRQGHTLVCEDVTVKSRVATANAITAEAARSSVPKK